MSTIAALFVTGLALGVSQCLIACAPMLVLYVAGTREGWREGLKATIVFSLARLLAYVVLGMLVVLISRQLLAFFEERSAILWVQIMAGAFVIMLGLLIMLGRNPHLHLCRYLSRHTLNNSILSMAILGFLIGIVPYCVPFLGILTYIAVTVQNPLLGALYGLAFGMGAALITPLLIAGPLAGLLPKLVFKSPVLLEAFRRISGVILLVFGIRLMLTVTGNI